MGYAMGVDGLARKYGHGMPSPTRQGDWAPE